MNNSKSQVQGKQKLDLQENGENNFDYPLHFVSSCSNATLTEAFVKPDVMQ